MEVLKRVPFAHFSFIIPMGTENSVKNAENYRSEFLHRLDNEYKGSAIANK